MALMQRSDIFRVCSYIEYLFWWCKQNFSFNHVSGVHSTKTSETQCSACFLRGFSSQASSEENCFIRIPSFYSISKLGFQTLASLLMLPRKQILKFIHTLKLVLSNKSVCSFKPAFSGYCKNSSLHLCFHLQHGDEMLFLCQPVVTVGFSRVSGNWYSVLEQIGDSAFQTETMRPVQPQ